MEALQLPATLDALGPIRDYVSEASKKAGLERKAAYNLKLAIDEIATNVILHGYEEAGLSGEIKISFEMNDEKIVLVLEDRGKPYDSRRHEDPSEADLELPLEERAIGGLGIFLALKGVDGFDYQSENGNNRNVFSMNRPN
ncbi:MAG TPA: anti-sigma regulatory factor [Cyanobacteria bacterium UBA8530]|nr:anti-sigma regulatory factor [Cyanobacteria bacterium UBA8530]